MSKAPSTRSRLVSTAARLLRDKGYHGVGLIELLAAARAPKGSLYHAFPAGKTDLALAAADHAAMEVLAQITAAFEPATTWEQGLQRYLGMIADGFEAGRRQCPIGPILADPPDNLAFRDRLAMLHSRWIRALAYQAIRLGLDEEAAESVAEDLLIRLQGTWILAAARNDAALLRDLGRRIPSAGQG